MSHTYISLRVVLATLISSTSLFTVSCSNGGGGGATDAHTSAEQKVATTDGVTTLPDSSKSLPFAFLASPNTSYLVSTGPALRNSLSLTSGGGETDVKTSDKYGVVTVSIRENASPIVDVSATGSSEKWRFSAGDRFVFILAANGEAVKLTVGDEQAPVSAFAGWVAESVVKTYIEAMGRVEFLNAAVTCSAVPSITNAILPGSVSGVQTCLDKAKVAAAKTALIVSGLNTTKQSVSEQADPQPPSAAASNSALANAEVRPDSASSVQGSLAALDNTEESATIVISETQTSDILPISANEQPVSQPVESEASPNKPQVVSDDYHPQSEQVAPQEIEASAESVPVPVIESNQEHTANPEGVVPTEQTQITDESAPEEKPQIVAAVPEKAESVVEPVIAPNDALTAVPASPDLQNNVGQSGDSKDSGSGTTGDLELATLVAVIGALPAIVADADAGRKLSDDTSGWIRTYTNTKNKCVQHLKKRNREQTKECLTVLHDHAKKKPAKAVANLTKKAVKKGSKR